MKPKLGDRGAEVLLEKVMNEISQAEMSISVQNMENKLKIGRAIEMGATSGISPRGLVF